MFYMHIDPTVLGILAVEEKYSRLRGQTNCLSPQCGASSSNLLE